MIELTLIFYLQHIRGYPIIRGKIAGPVGNLFYKG